MYTFYIILLDNAKTAKDEKTNSTSIPVVVYAMYQCPIKYSE
jgi:hypothetical protein